MLSLDHPLLLCVSLRLSASALNHPSDLNARVPRTQNCLRQRKRKINAEAERRRDTQRVL